MDHAAPQPGSKSPFAAPQPGSKSPFAARHPDHARIGGPATLRMRPDENPRPSCGGRNGESWQTPHLQHDAPLLPAGGHIPHTVTGAPPSASFRQ